MKIIIPAKNKNQVTVVDKYSLEMVALSLNPVQNDDNISETTELDKKEKN